ncbi:hypothetical protein OS493_007643 [Desmophyllum pertusum]|uniref:Uncharacterized protein n=1 Tax=Desmophyllum pertusum TaxID=174260 RepID=A0A9X0CM60_9CNID|nr:hypothetical protein OS493_007643 [Desmophyllum pertusum]
MCEFCITAHKRINATKDHQILSLEEVRKLGGQALAKPAFCEKHVVTFSEVNKQVDFVFDEQVKALEHQRAKLKLEATTQGQVKVNQIESQTEMLSLVLAQLQIGIDFTDRAIADGDDVKLLSMKKQLIQRLSQLNSSQNQLAPCEE